MEFSEKIEQLKERAIGLKDSLQTEEATKNNRQGTAKERTRRIQKLYEQR